MLPIRSIFLTFLILLALGVGNVTYAQRSKAPARGRTAVVRVAAAVTPDAKRRLEAFEKVWQILNDYYFDKTFNGLDWQAVKREYEPKVKATKTDSELHKLLSEMIARLGSSHLSIIPPEVYEEIDRAKNAARVRMEKRNARFAAGAAAEEDDEEFENFDDPLAKYGIGIDLRLIDGKFVVTRVGKNSAAEYAGMKPGYVIEKVNDLDLSQLLVRLTIYYRNSRSLINQVPTEVVESFINGEKDSPVNITYLDDKDARQELTITRELLKGQTISIGKNFPEKHLEFETASYSDDIGYVRFSQFAFPVIDKFCNAIGQFKDKKGVVIDLRGNTGGLIAAAIGLSGMLSDQPVDLGTSLYKYGSEKMTGAPKAKNYKGRVVFLVDETTASAAEMFAVSFQDSGRALVVGEKTSGATLPSVVTDLPTGAVMQYPIANYRSSKGAFLEGSGVSPNFVVSLDRKTLTAGTDAQLEKAFALIRDEKQFLPKPAPELRGPIFTIKGSGDGPAPPPPPPPAKAPPMTVGPPVESNTKDAAAVRVIEEFLTLAGGRKLLEKMDSYEARGKAEMVIRGAVHDFEYTVYRKPENKYSEIMKSPSIGEIRDIYNGKNYITQADYGFFREVPLPAGFDLTWMEIFAPIRVLAKPDSFKTLKYAGTYERDGRKVHLVDAQSKSGENIAFTFDAETKMLSYYTGSLYGIIFSDYRKVGDAMMPFGIERERLMRLKFDEVKLNGTIDEGRFAKKINCYDVP